VKLLVSLVKPNIQATALPLFNSESRSQIYLHPEARY